MGSPSLSAAASENRLWNQLEVEQAENERLLRGLEIAQTVGDRFASGDLMLLVVHRKPVPDSTNFSFALSPTARLATNSRKMVEVNYTEIYTNYVRLSDELAAQKDNQ